MSRKIQEALRYCEESFEKGSLELALRCAVSISMANPKEPAPYAHVTTYSILLKAANNRTVTGEPDWYAVLGIKRRSSSSKSVAKSIERRCLEILELLNGETVNFKAASVVYDLVSRGIDELKNDDRKREYDQRSGFSLVN